MEKISLWIAERFWIQPAVYSIIAFSLAVGVFYVDVHYADQLEGTIPGFLLVDMDLAKTILSGLSAALLTMTTFTFSIIMVVLTTYSSQFSPRTLKNFVQDKTTWRVLGVFMGGFIYNTFSLLLVNEVPSGQLVLSSSIGIIFAFICLTFFAFFVHHVATEIQVSTLIEELADEAEQVILDYTELHEKKEKTARQIEKKNHEWTFAANLHGYIQLIEFQKLIEFAEKAKATVELTVHVGDFIHHKKTVMKIYSDQKPDIQVDRYIVTGKEQDVRQDPEFAIQKLVEIALRAISPGINDPNTAIHNIRQLGRLLGSVSDFPNRGGVFYDSKDVPRIIYPVHPFNEVLHKTFFQLRHYGKEDISVLAAITDSLIIAAELSDKEVYADLWDMQLYIIEGMNQSSMLSLDRKFYQRKIDMLAKITEKETVQLPVGLPNYENDPGKEVAAENKNR